VSRNVRFLVSQLTTCGRLFRGHLVLDVDVPTMLLDQCSIKEGNEFTKMRYTAVTCDPNDFTVSKNAGLDGVS
jgi:hypothetical protein